MEKITIGELARRTGVAASAIRYYESVGVLPKPQRVHGRRRYDHDAVVRLTAVTAAKQAGFSVKEIRTFVRAFADGTSPSTRWKLLAEEKLTELDATITRLEAMKSVLRKGMTCSCLDLRECKLLDGSL